MDRQEVGAASFDVTHGEQLGFTAAPRLRQPPDRALKTLWPLRALRIRPHAADRQLDQRANRLTFGETHRAIVLIEDLGVGIDAEAMIDRGG